MTYTRPELVDLAFAATAIQSDSARKDGDHIDNFSNYASSTAYEVDE